MFDLGGQTEEFRWNISDLLEFDSFYCSEPLFRILLYSLTVFQKFTNSRQIPLRGLHFRHVNDCTRNAAFMLPDRLINSGKRIGATTRLHGK